MSETRHSTTPHGDIADPRAVRRALRPRRAWPWPDLEDAIAAVERWTEAGVDLRAPLRRLTWPVVRRTNVGFVPALVRRGVAVPPDVVAAAGRALRKLVDGHAADDAWHRYAEWFADLVPDLAVTVLQRLALAEPRPEQERYRAWAFLDARFPEDSDWVAVVLASDSRLHPATRAAIARALTTRDPSVAVAVFDRVARQSTDGAIRNQAAGVLEPLDPRKALDRFAETAADKGQGDSVRLAASHRVLAHDRSRGVTLLFALLADASVDAVRADVMERLRREDPKRLGIVLDGLRLTGSPQARLQVTRYLYEHYRRGPGIVAELATAEDVPAEIRFASLDIDRTVATPKVVSAIVESFTSHGPAKVRAVALEATLDPDSAFAHLGGIVADRRIPFHDRMAAVAEAARPLAPHRRTDLYGRLAAGDGATPAQRDAAVAATTAIDAAEGRKLCEELARHRDLAADERLRFADRAGRDRALALVREFARDNGEDGVTRVAAARRAASTGGTEDRLYLRTLAATPSVPYALREGLIGDLSPADRIAVLRTIAESVAETGEDRLAGAIALGGLDPDGAAAKLRALAEDRGVTSSVRARARDAERRLR